MTALLPALAVFLVLAVAVGGAFGLASRFAPRPWAESSLAWSGAIVGPLLVASIATAALVVATPFSPCHCLEHGHHPHICFVHSELAAPLVLPAAALLLVWLVLAGRPLWRAVRAAIGAARTLRDLRRAPSELVAETRVRFADCGAPIAYTAGALSSLIVVDRALWSRLSEAARRAVLAHEVGHAERGDAFTHAVLRFCLALQPWLPATWLERWRHAAELACDRRAAEQVGDPALVAEALVAVGKLQADAPAPPGERWALGVTGADGLENRVRALLEDRRSSGLANDVLSVVIPALGIVCLALVWPGDAVHHAVETLIGLFTH